VQVKASGINPVRAKLASGEIKTYYYHRASGTRLVGSPGSPEFLASYAAAEESTRNRNTGTLSGLIRDFEATKQWRRLAESTKKEYKRILTFWDAEYGTCPYRALEDKAFRADVVKWHDKFSEAKPREADGRVTVLARVLSWGAKDGPLKINVLDGFERAYASDRSDIIWLPEHVEAFLSVASDEMKLAMMLALHTGQRQGDILRLAWTQYDGTSIALRQGKAKRLGRMPPSIRVPCTKGLKATLDVAPRRAAVILATKTGRAFKKRYFASQWEATCEAAGITDLHFHGYQRHHGHDAFSGRLQSRRDRLHHGAYAAPCSGDLGQISGPDEQDGGQRHCQIRERLGNRFCKTACKMRWRTRC
jgi:integrase